MEDMVSNTEVTLRIFEATILAIPIWIGVLKYSKTGLNLSLSSQDTGYTEKMILTIMQGVAISGSFGALLYASFAAGVTVLGISNQATAAIASIWLFLLFSGYIGITNFTSKVTEGSRLWVEIFILVLITAMGVGYFLSLT